MTRNRRGPRTYTPAEIFGDESEADLQAEIIEYLKIMDFLTLRVNSGKRGGVLFCRWVTKEHGTKTRGASDLLAFSPWDKVFVIENKGQKTRVSADQKLFRDAMRKRGYVSFMPRSLEEVQAVIERYMPR